MDGITAWVGQTASGLEVVPMNFSFADVLMFAMFVLALLTYVSKRK